MIFEECKHHKWKHFSHTCWNMQVRENSTSILRDKTLRSLKKIKKMYPCEANLKGKDKVVKNTVNQFSGSNQWVQIFWKMREFRKRMH